LRLPSVVLLLVTWLCPVLLVPEAERSRSSFTSHAGISSDHRCYHFQSCPYLAGFWTPVGVLLTRLCSGEVDLDRAGRPGDRVSLLQMTADPCVGGGLRWHFRYCYFGWKKTICYALKALVSPAPNLSQVQERKNIFTLASFTSYSATPLIRITIIKKQ
jgi:hypothetical protein